MFRGLCFRLSLPATQGSASEPYPPSLAHPFPPPLPPQHFHYSYLVNVAAVLAHLRPDWIDDTKVEWVNTLLRDVNSPDKVSGDTHTIHMMAGLVV